LTDHKNKESLFYDNFTNIYDYTKDWKRLKIFSVQEDEITEILLAEKLFIYRE